MGVSHSRFRLWASHPAFDAATRAEVAALEGQLGEIEERFGSSLAFGTAGLRGIIGAGTNRMNRYTVRQATRGLADAIVEAGPDACRRGVVIAYDCRRCSPEFAREAALTLAAAGVRAYLWDSLRPTPMLSYAVRELRAIAGIMITASHNPPEYNGYKVYGEDGGQLPPERAALIEARIRAADIPAIPVADEASARDAGVVQFVPPVVDRSYQERLLRLVGEDPQGIRAGCRVLFTPLHGTGHLPIRDALTAAGFTVTVVPEQAEPDSEFPTVTVPNPEEPSVFEPALRLAATVEPDVILATDPDADRLGVMARDTRGGYRLLTGNQIGALLVAFLLDRYAQEGRLPANGVVLKSIASANMVQPICATYGVTLIETHTGFKYIADRMREFEETGSHSFLFGFEESYGFLAAPFVRDKDAVMAALLVAEAAAHHKARGKTLHQVLEELFWTYGWYREALRSATLPGSDGLQRMAALMAELRADPPKSFGPALVAAADDYLTGVSLNPATGETRPLTLGKADVLHYRFADGGFVMVRPSGTEPKLKIYTAVVTEDPTSSQALLNAVQEAALARLGLDG